MSETVKKGEPISFEMVLKTAAGLPGVRIEREQFLAAALKPYYADNIVEKAIMHNPAYAGIRVEEIDKIANASIRLETRNVTALSFAAGLPGGFAMVGTVPADLAQYFGHILRILQKLIYLYGWEELFDENGYMDDETANMLTLFTGIMFGVSGAANAVVKIAEQAAQRTAKKLAQKALTKGAIYPIVKKVAVALGFRMTKDIFAKGVSKVIPILGGVASGGLTYLTYKPMAIKLRDHLATLKFADVDFYASAPVEAVVAVEEIDEEPIAEEQAEAVRV